MKELFLAALRTEIEMGKYRPIGSDGPPPLNVTWNPSTFRRQSEPEMRGFKRPATEQSTEQPQAKRVRVAGYADRTLETVQEVSYSDALGHQRLQLKVHNLSSRLAQRSVKDASKLLMEQRTKLKIEIKQMKEKLGRKHVKRQNNQPRPQSCSISYWHRAITKTLL